jgi:integrase/recombinase XerC/integrase/recombinase XerD
MRHIRIFLGFCYEKELIKEAIHLKIQMPKAEKPVVEILTDEETSRLIESVKDNEYADRNRVIVYLMLDCGLRLSEVAGVRVSDVNYDSGYIIVKGKGRKSRIVPIGKKVGEELKAYSIGLGCNIGFFNIKPEGIAKMITRMKKKTGITRLHAHLLRHTFATNFLIHGLGDVYELSRILGHGDIKITEGYVQLASYYKILRNPTRQTYLDIKESIRPLEARNQK